MEKIIVAFESEKTALRVKELLEGGGAAACLVCRTADQVRRAINKLPVPAVVCGYKLGIRRRSCSLKTCPPPAPCWCWLTRTDWIFWGMTTSSACHPR